MSRITYDQVKILAASARIHIEEQEIPHIAASINEILQYVDVLNQAPKNLEELGYEPAATSKKGTTIRKDEVNIHDTDSLLTNGPKVHARSFVVPEIITR